jgi:FkbM family methyltransferase
MRFKHFLDRYSRSLIIEIEGVKFIPNDFHCLYSILAPNYEEWVWSYLRLKEDDVFLDVGAHIGRYALLAAKKVKNGLVIAIEPDPINYNTLIKNIQINNFKNVLALNVAAWDSNTELRLITGMGTGERSVIRNKHSRCTKVLAKILDDVLENYKVRKIDWIKIDVEGVAHRVVKGLRSTLKEQNPKVIIEVHHETPEFIEVLKLMKQLSYSATIIHEVPSTKNTYFYFEKM